MLAAAPGRPAPLPCTGVPAEAEHHVTGPLAVAVGLALTAGFVDAFIYLNIAPVFVANMSGNMVRVGIAIGDGDGHAVIASFVAIIAFVAAAVVSAMVVDHRIRAAAPAERRRADPAPLLLAEVALLGLVAVVAIHWDVLFTTRLAIGNLTVVALGAAAMGVQAIALRRVGQIAVSTTYGTGALVRIGEKIGLALRGAPRPHGVRRSRSAAVLTAVLAAYVAGAAIAAAVPLHRSLLGIVPFVLLALAGAAHRLHDPDAPDRRQAGEAAIVSPGPAPGARE